MNALEINPDGSASQLSRVSFGADRGFREDWIQRLVFETPNVVPLDWIEAGAGQLIPLAREFALSRPGGPVFLDCLAITPAGRIVLIECKLWNNPQARREVVAQLIEYAALLKGMSYADLTARLTQLDPGASGNPIYERARLHGSKLHEIQFVDAASRSLEIGDFHLIIVGDGIRSDLHAIGAYINAALGAFNRLSLVELQVWRSDAGKTIVLPQLPLTTQILQHRLIVDSTGLPLQVVPDEQPEQTVAPRGTAGDTAAQRLANRSFWQSVLDTVHIDHPDQPPPRHGGNNWIRFEMPAGRWLTAYRYGPNEIGIWMPLLGEDGALIFGALREEEEAIRRETGLDVRMIETKTDPFHGRLIVKSIASEARDDKADVEWLADTANRLVTSIRPRLAQLERGLTPGS